MSGLSCIMSRRNVMRGVAGLGLAAPLTAVVPKAVRAQVTVEEPITQELDIVYGEVDGQQLLVDVFRPPIRETPRPAVVCFGGFGARAIWHPNARALAGAGYVTFLAAYRTRLPEHIDDAQLAVRWIRASAATHGVDPARIGSYGHSVGGQLAAMLGTRDTRNLIDPILGEYSSRVSCVVDIAGLNDLTVPPSFPISITTELSVEQALGGTLEDVPETYREVSPSTFIDKQSAPFLLVHGGRDRFTPVEQSQRMVEALQAADVEVIYVFLPGATSVSVASWVLTGGLILAFFERHLHPER